MKLPRQEYCSGYSLLQGIFPAQGLNWGLLHWQEDSLLSPSHTLSLAFQGDFHYHESKGSGFFQKQTKHLGEVLCVEYLLGVTTIEKRGGAIKDWSQEKVKLQRKANKVLKIIIWSYEACTNHKNCPQFWCQLGFLTLISHQIWVIRRRTYPCITCSAPNHKKAVKRSFDLWVGQEVLAWERIWAVFVHLCVHHCSTYNVDLYGSLTL